MYYDFNSDYLDEKKYLYVTNPKVYQYYVKKSTLRGLSINEFIVKYRMEEFKEYLKRNFAIELMPTNNEP